MKYQVCRPLTPIEYAALKMDIAENGVLVPIDVDENGDILDGHHRVQAWQELRAEGMDVPQYAKMVRQGLTEEQKRNHARKLNVLRRQMTKEERKQIMVGMKLDGASYRKIAEAVGVDPVTVLNTVKKAGVEISTPVNGIDGKTYPAQQQPKPEPPPTLFVPGNEALGVNAPNGKVKVATSRTLFWKSSKSNEWYTPEDINELIRVALGGTIYLDPASCADANKYVGALRYFTKEDDGLSCDWTAQTVFCNPPYGTNDHNRSWAAIWTAKMYQEFVAGHFAEGILLVPLNKFQFPGVQALMGLPNRRVCHPTERIDFVPGDDKKRGGANFPSMLIYVGPHPDRFTRTFWHLGTIDQQATLPPPVL